MNSKPAKIWCLKFLTLVLSAAGLIAATNYAVDFYGLFQDPSGKKLVSYSNERTAKYLFSYRYIPANFDGILIGSSISANWDMSKIHGAHLYNASISGGNISEEKLIADNVLARKNIKMVIFCIHPYLTETHGRKSGYMDTREYWGALGSIQLFREYANLLLARSHPLEAKFDENGRFDFEAEAALAAKAQPHPGPKEMSAATTSFTVDEKAYVEYAQLVASARANGARIVAFIPPIYAGVYNVDPAKYEAYFARMSALFLPNERVLNFNRPAYASYTGSAATFFDGSHLTTEAADFFSSELARALQPPLGKEAQAAQAAID
ncbi:hypothetical protein AAKU55_000793 [Oxalobacteraceae bacterium GrIS 1.11]